ncbi:MAG TPA: hypothetical protein VH186_24040 [Chloroflexia bacterium]|nr:hypothetical protein [Chloroflexia bacterium]
MPLEKSSFDLWQEGEINAEEALNQLTGSLTALEDRLEPLEATRKTLRDQIGMVVEVGFSGRASINGYNIVNTGASQTVSYDAKALDKLVDRLMREGNEAVAREILACRKEGSRAGSTRISRLKE